MGFSILLTVILGLIFLMPWLISIILRLFLHKYIKKITATGFFSFRNVKIVFGPNTLQIQKVSLCVATIFQSSDFLPEPSDQISEVKVKKLLLLLEGVNLQISSIPKASSSKSSVVGMLFLRLILTITASFLVIRAKNIEINAMKNNVHTTSAKVQMAVMEDGALVFHIFVTKLYINSAEVIGKVSETYIKIILPGEISFKRSIQDCEISIVIGKVSAKLSNLPQESSGKSGGVLPKSINCLIHKLHVELFTLNFVGYSVNFSLKPLSLNIALITGFDVTFPAIHIPQLQISQDSLGAVNVSSKYLGISLIEVIPVIFKFIRPKPSSSSSSNEKPSVNVPFLLSLDQIEARFPGSQGSAIEATTIRVSANSEIQVSAELITLGKYLNVVNFNTLINDSTKVSYASADLDLDEDIIKETIGCFAELYRAFPLLPKSNGPKKTVKLNFLNSSVKGTYPDGFKLLVTVSQFTATILPKFLDLNFVSSTIYDLETQKHHIITTNICKVHKEYKHGTAEIEVIGDQIEIHLPRQYFLARAVIKFLRGSHKVYKWCKFAFLQVHRSHTHIPEKSNLTLTFRNFIFDADDHPIDMINIKKATLNPEDTIYPQLLTTNQTYPLLALTMKTATVKLNNLELDTMEKIKGYMGEIDDFSLPYDEFFAVMLAYDFTCVGKGLNVRVRDYPYDICEIKQIKFGGRTILTKNRLLTPIWACFKHHYDIEVCCLEVATCLGICHLKVLMDLMKIVKYLFFVKPSAPSSVKKLELVDFLRYFLHGKMTIIVKSCKNLLLKSSSPYVYEGFNLDIAECSIALEPNCIKSTVKGIQFYYGENYYLTLPLIKSQLDYEIECKNANHWVVYPNGQDMFADFRSSEINPSLQLSLIPEDTQNLTICYNLSNSPELTDFIALLSTPPVTLIPVREKSPAKFFKNFNKIELTHMKVVLCEIYLLIEGGDGAFLSIESINLSAHCEHLKDHLVLPWKVIKANGNCCNIKMVQYFPGQTDQKSLLDCSSIEYTYNQIDSNFLSIEDFIVFISPFFVNLITELVISRPVNVSKLFAKKRGNNKKWGIRTQKFTIRSLLKGIIKGPKIALVNQDDDSKLVINGGTCEFDILEELLKFDIYHKDMKKRAKFSINKIECVLDENQEDLTLPVIFSTKGIDMFLTYFTCPASKIDFARNCENIDENIWYKEKRVNRLEISLPEVAAGIESSEFWSIIEIVKDFIGFIPKNRVSVSERLMEDEFRSFGGKELVKMFNDNSKKILSVRTTESKLLRIIVQKLTVSLKRNSATLIELTMNGIKFNTTNYNDLSCQKSLEIHKIEMKHGNTVMITPLLAGNEEYLPSNIMLNLRILDRWVRGSQTLWPVVDHHEFLVFPLKLNFSKEIYKDLYAFFFNEDKPKSKSSYRRIKLPRLYKYIHQNEIKICITVTGWIALNNSKITIKPFTRQNKFKTFQGLFDKIMNHGLKCIISQVPSICIQNLGISKKNFIPSTEPNKKLLDKLKKKKPEESLTEQDLQKNEGIKLMFGKNFKGSD